MALLLIGLNHRTTPVELRERLYLNRDKLFPVLTKIKNQSPAIQETAIVSTCNRLEVYAAVSDVVAAEHALVRYLCQHYGISRTELNPHLYVKQERIAVRHLMQVACGLDSMILGETQILGQVGDALECATTVQTAGTLLHRLFEASMRAGKRARTETAISQQTTSVSHAAALLVRNRIDTPDPAVLVIGAGEMAELAATATLDHDMTDIRIINRTFKHGKALAEKIDGVALDWSQLWEQLAEVDVVISATGAPHTVLYANDIQRVIDQRDGKPLILVDVAVPRDIDPEVNALDGIISYDIDALQQVVDDSLASREACVPQVEAIVHEEETKYWQWLGERQVVPVIKDLRKEVHDVVAAELEDALNKLSHIDESDRDTVKRMAHRIVNKVLHSPTVSLREHATIGDAENFAEIVRELFALPQANEAEDDAQTPLRMHA